jgi:hypothetical protein
MSGKWYVGNDPDSGVVVAENEGWKIFEMQKKSQNQWLSLKAVSKVKRRNKANFWLAWNGDRFAAGKDLAIMVQHWPELYEWAHSVMAKK